MDVKEKQIFNLWDTNGRRNDVLNALSIYLNILKEMKDEGGFDHWASFPDSLTQLSFYQKAIEQSPEVFKKHPQFDSFVETLGLDFSTTLNKNKLSKLILNNQSLLRTLDEAIEQRARHYTSNLVRFGLASENRTITPAGQAFLNGKIERDQIEEFLPFSDLNIILLRQLLKLRIFTREIEGKRKYYSPFFVSLYLLLNNDTFDKNDFTNIVQGISPYCNTDQIRGLLLTNNYAVLLNLINSIDIRTPLEFVLPTLVSKDVFNSYIKNRKSGEAQSCYYDFYVALYSYVANPSIDNYESLKNCYLSEKDKIRKAFCLGRGLFDFGSNGVYDLELFIQNNTDNPFLNSVNLNSVFYEFYEKSKYVDQLEEYSDTTIRALGATGLFKFKPNVALSFKRLFTIIFNHADIGNLFFGEMTEEEYKNYEVFDSCLFGANTSISEILKYGESDLNDVISKLSIEYGTSDKEIIKNKIETKISDDFKKYIETNYPLDKVIELLQLFSDRTNDSKIKSIVNPSATVPTIYEYIVGIAWYYISEKDFDLFNALNMTLNADFEPEMHAGGGAGDIVINYSNRSILIEATLMNKVAQKRGEWEPVLRHSLNNKAEHMAIDSYTFFVANELDFNTINIWRAVAAAPLRSTTSDTDINGIIIMPFSNSNIISFLKNSVHSSRIIEVVKESFSKVPKITEFNWFDDIIKSL